MISVDYATRQKREYAIRQFHESIDVGKFRGWNCSCDYEFRKLEVFKEMYDKWLS